MGVKRAGGEVLCTFAGMASLALGSGLCGCGGACGLCLGGVGGSARAGAPCLLGFALLVVFVGALLVVSVSVLGCLWPSYWSRGINYSYFIVLVGKPFPGCQGACVAFYGLSCW